MSETAKRTEDGLIRIFQRVYGLMTRGERRKSLVMLFTVMANSIVEVLGLAAVVPVIGLAVEPELVHRSDYLSRFYQWSGILGVSNEQHFLLVMAVGLVIVFGVKAAVGLLLTLYQTRFSFSVALRISGMMWTHHFSQNLEQMNGSEAGRILTEINGWPGVFANAYMVGSLRLITEFFVMGVIGLGLLAYAPSVFIAVATLIGLGSWFVRWYTDERLRSYGKIQKDLEPRMNSMLTNAVRGFLEVITFRAVESVKNEYLATSKGLFRIAGASSVLNSLPAKTYEVLAVMGVSGAIVMSILQGTGNEEFFELLALMAVSAYRVMPSMSRINGVMMGMRQGMYAIEAIERGARSWEHLKSTEPLGALNFHHPPAMELMEITVGYASLESPVLESLSHRFEPGRIHAIVGASGSGKSTLVSAMLGLHPLDRGSIVIEDGQCKWVLGETCSQGSWLGEVGYLSQQPFFFSGSVEDNLTFRAPGRRVDVPQVMELVNRLGLKECLGEDPLSFHLNEAGSNLSGGQQQRLALLRSLQVDTKVLLLDEATSALDVDSRDRVFQLLRERADRGTLILMITHDRELAAMCDEVLELES